MSNEGGGGHERGAVRAIVAGHGDFAAGLVSAVEQITGRGNQLVAVPVQGLGAEDIESLLRERMLATGIRVVFTDVQAGSCTMAARRVLRGMTDAVVVCGTNLPVLLDFVFNEQATPTEAARHATERGRAAIALVGSKA
jgi:PTS system N-acetylgalactosamine-specific IIA component